MSNVKIYTVDDEEPNCNRCDHVCDSDILNMMEFNIDKINDYLGELRSSILK